MTSQNIPEEIFRFSIVRNPEPASSKALQDGAIRILPDDAERTHLNYGSLLQFRRQGMLRRGIIDHAARIMSNPKFLQQLDILSTPIFEFSDRLYVLHDLRIVSVRNLVMSVFGTSEDEIVDDEIENDRMIIADSLILASFATPPVTGLRGRLMRALRAIEVIRRLADSEESELDDQAIKHLLNATLLLPSALFSMPSNNVREEENHKEYQRRKEPLIKENERVQRLLDHLARNAAAVEELSGTLSMQLFESRHLNGEETPALNTTTVLPRARVERLSETTKKAVLDDLGISADTVDVPFVVELLEKQSIHLGHDLVTDFGNFLLDARPFNLPGCGECKPVILPEPNAENDFTPDTRGEAELIGVQDLLIVRQSLREYRAGEIAHIENVLKGERKAKKHRKTHRSEITLVEEIEREEEVEDELQTTDKYELQTESSRVIQEDKSAEAGVTVTASYGPVNIEAHGNYAHSGSTTEMRSSAATYAQEVVSHSLQRIRERVLTRRSRTDISEVEVINEHEFDNKEGTTGHVIGIYRWVDKIYEAQIMNYGKRTMLEFMIPDPAAFYRFATANKPTSGPIVPRPDMPGFCRNGVFHPLAPTDLQPENYMCFVGKYTASGVAPPMPRYIRISDVLKFKFDGTTGESVPFAEVNDSFKVPEGYVPRAITYTISGGNSHSAITQHDKHDDIILVIATIENFKVFRLYKSEIGEVNGEDHWEDIEQLIEWGSRPLSPIEQAFGGYAEGQLSGSFPLNPMSTIPGDADVVKVSLTGHTTLPMSVSIHYTVLCERSQAKFQQWQIDTFNAIQGAYLALKQEYEAHLQSQEAIGLTNIQGRNPLLNREMERRELKKFAISLLTGQQYESFNAMEEDYFSRIPQIDLADAAAEGKFVRFFEQALEWKHMTYLFYPYFWANKKNWVTAINQKDIDPLFEQFLQAGYARVWVPVRPGFDLVIANYIQIGGEPWTEKDAPLVEESGVEPPFVSVIEEIKEQLGADFEFRAGTLRVRKGNVLVTGNGTDLREDDIDREILIALQYYRIAEVDVAAQILSLTEPYGGEDDVEIGFAIGAKFVGEPWLVQVPTTLVHLKADADLIIG